MHGTLWVLGLITAAVGFLTIGFGIPDKEFSFGNTLIIAGTFAAVGGLILIGLAAAVRQLKRIADAEHRHPNEISHPASLRAPNEPTDPRTRFINSQISQGLAPAPAPTAPPAPSPRSPGPPEPRPTAPSAEANPIEWLRPKDAVPTMGERAVIEEFEASLGSQQPEPPPFSQPAPPPQRAAFGANSPRTPDPRPMPPNTAGESSWQMNAPRSEPALRATAEHESGSFDAVWPETRTGRSSETVERVRRSEPSGQTASPEDQRPVAILKSGMIDGMAYTLFADGSIEAVLPTGTLRFASVEALRLHLEKNA